MEEQIKQLVEQVKNLTERVKALEEKAPGTSAFIKAVKSANDHNDRIKKEIFD